MTLPPPISLVSLGIRPFCGSLLFTEISEVSLELLVAALSSDDEPHAATDISMVPAAAMATRQWSMFLFIVFSSDVDIPSLMTAERQ